MSLILILSDCVLNCCRDQLALLFFLGCWLYVECLEGDEIERLIDVVSVHCIPVGRAPVGCSADQVSNKKRSLNFFITSVLIWSILIHFKKMLCGVRFRPI